MGKKKKKDIIRLERESVVPILKSKLVQTLAYNFEHVSERDEFVKFCQRVECTIRAWYLLQFEDLMQLYALFDPIYGARKLEQHNLTPEQVDVLELSFLNHLFKVMDKSNFKITTDDEIEVALSAQYRLNLPIIVDESKLDKRLLTRYFTKYPEDNLPQFADKYIIFRRGIGLDHNTAYFYKAKLNTIILKTWRFFLKVTGLKTLLFGKSSKHYHNDSSQPVEISIEDEQDSLYVERIRIEKINLSIAKLLGKITIQEPTFDRIIVVYRRKKTRNQNERGIYVKHFKNIPMADLEIVLPEKKNPSLTPMDWVKFLVSAAIGMVTVVSSLSMPTADIRVIFAVLSAVIGYCIKTYFSFQSNLVAYQSLITQSVYEKQLDSGRGTLLHLCDEVIQQEVKEVIISFFILRECKKSTRQDLDLRCEQLIKEEFGESCNFDVDDAVRKLKKLGIVSQDSTGMYSCVDLKQANEIIGITTEEFVLKATKEDSG
ncbi:uncharacterized protein LOC133816969 [Humulus lupulus]|uniref:uncharacterized protein LOC133816969 n=1 Tax=Humulus lupulus TaxID=3486 RepID=UPI002B402323|nr:uncharacterized protein LOC133816969 [Humulus lupulus]